MNIARVKTLSPIERWAYFVEEREKVRLAKKAGAPRPWTDDEIIDTYRFCNMRRMDDKVSQWLLHNWYEPYRDHPNMLLATAYARFINKPESLREITTAVFQKQHDHDLIVRLLRFYRDAGNTVFNGAYMVRGNDGMDKIDCVVNYYVAPLAKYNAVTSSMEQTWQTILPSFGMGSFMAGQIVADLRWALSGLWRDRKTWAPIGPGSMRGMNRLQERGLKEQVSQTAFVFNLQRLIEKAEALLPEQLVERMEAQDWQNTLCEFDKYERVLWGEGKPKQLYKPGK